MFRWWFTSFIFLLLPLPLAAVTNSAWFSRAWQAEDGLPEFTIVGLAQTPDGYLWVATHGSLSRFDGVRFQEFSPVKPAGPTTDQIRAMVVDRRGRLWLVRDGGTVVCVEAGMITNVIHLKDALPVGITWTMTEDAQGGIWLSDSTGRVFQIQDGKARAFGTAEGLAGQGSCWLATDIGGRLWFSQAGRVGVFRDGRFVTLFTLGQPSSRLAAARQGGIWLCAGLKLFHCQEGGELEEVTELKLESGGAVGVNTLYEDQSHSLWIGTSSSGLFRFDSQGVKSVETSHPNIINILEDAEGNLWVGTRGGGLNRLSPQAVQLLGPASGLPFAAVQSACEDAAGKIWVVGQYGALACRSRGVWSLMASNAGWSGGSAICVAELDGAVLIGSRERGMFRQQDGVFVPLAINQHQQLTNRLIRALYVSPKKELWIALNGGVARHRLLDGSLTYFPLPPGASDVRTMVEDATGDLWMGTTSDGLLLRVHGDSLINETTNIMRGPQHIRCLQVTSDGSLWLGFVGQGLGWLKNGRYFQFHANHGLRDEYISQILPDDRGRLWLAGNRGIFQVPQSELEAVAGGRPTLLRSVVFGRGEGVPNLKATFGVSPSATRTRDGRLLMPMLTGLAIIDPAVLRDHPTPPVIIERFKVNGRVTAAYDISGQSDSAPLPTPVNLRALSSPLRLDPGVNELDFEFTALSLAAPENVTFRYQLEGVDNDWVEAGPVRVAHYPHVSPGDYRFRVIACTHDGIWNDVGSSLAFTVSPYFWETTWFRATAVMSAAVLLGGGVLMASRRRYQRKLERLQQQQALERERTRIAQDLHDDLGAGLVEINFGSELAQDPALGMNEVREHTREIGTRAKEMVTALDEIVWAVNPKHDSVSSLATYFCQFAQHFLRATPVRCHLEIASDLPAAPLNAEQRHSLFLAFKEALSNLAQHAGATDLHLAIAVTDGMLIVELRDNGRGFDLAAPRERSNPDGLGNMQRRLQQLGGRCELASSPGQGTTVSFKVPLAITRHAATHNSIEVL